MAKATNKKNKRLKKTIRKTLGTLFLVSAILVAAIPVENLQAEGEDAPRVTVDIENCQIPVIDESETIYTTGDGQYQFAYVSPNNASSNNKVAVILGYNGGYLENGNLTLPDKLDAYLKYSDNLGTSSGYSAVGKSGNFLFYSVDEIQYDSTGQPITELVPVKDADGNYMKDENGNTIYEEKVVTKTVYYPCYYEDRARWEHLEVDEFYYHPDNTVSDNSAGFLPTTQSQYQRIQGAEVWYIGNQYLEAGTGENSGTWKIPSGGGFITAENKKGIFAGQGNIRNLTVGVNLSGIGNYAFYGCSGLDSITLGNGLDTISNYAFANCINMKTVTLDYYSRVNIIGDHAFYNCQSLESFNVPISVTEIGDSAFEYCTSMTDIDLCGGGAKVSLIRLGDDVFKSCTSLEFLTFPGTFTNSSADTNEPEAIDVSMFEGCEALKYISTSNNMINFKEGDNTEFGFAEFKETVPAEFYFEGLTDSPVHLTSTEQNIAFSHLGKDLYEITVVDENDDSIKAVYRVNSSNQLVYTNIDDRMTNVELPKTIGPYKILEIDSGTFQDNHKLEKITIPSSITAINEDAFKGCYKLKDVIFSEPTNITYIGPDAFKTQEPSLLEAGDTLDEMPVLNFIGPISYDSVPFEYATNPDNMINVGSQPRTYITYHSGWPTHLVVQYNYDTDKNELVDYPTFADISNGTKYIEGNYAYMTEEYEDAAALAVAKYTGQNTDPMTDYEREIIAAAIDIVLPSGIESVQEGLFIDKEIDGEPEKTITAYSLNEIAGAEYDAEGNEIKGGAFKGCKNLKGIYLMGETTSIGTHAFEGCEILEAVSVPDTVTEMGLAPFLHCDELSHVDFQGSKYFTCEDSIIYELDSEGNKYKVVEFLNGRATGVVAPTEMEGVKAVAPEAFMSTHVSSVDFRTSEIEEIPESTFEDTEKLFAVYLPDTCKAIEKDAFKDSSIAYMEVPGSVSYIDNDAFSGSTNKSGLQFYCEEGSNADIYAEKQGILTTSKPIELSYTVTFWDWDSTLLDTQVVEAGQDAIPPEVPGRTGYVHTGWVPDYRGVTADLQITAQYEAEDPNASKFTVTFLDYDDTVLKTMLVAPGEDAEPPFDPVREGYVFIGWRPSVTNIQEDTTIYAQYEKKDSSESEFTVRFIDYDDTVLYTQRVASGESAITPQDPSREGYVFTGWRPAITEITKDLDTYAQYEKIGDGTSDDGTGDGTNDGTGDGSGDSDGNGDGSDDGDDGDDGDDETTTKLYTLTVQNGSGSGSYAAGSQPIVIANDPASGMEFSHWTIAPTSTKIASTVLTATVVTMPEDNVTVTAHYKKRTGNYTTTGSGNSGSTSTNRPGTSSGTISNGGTTVVIDKNGLSNTGVVSATVNGSSDDFTIKITESSSAAEAVVRALQAEYGDLDGIKYFPMDISLYDSTGKKKITDTTGLSISITLPLPDSLITYAGNNKVASVVDNRLDKLTPKFTTISGVSCVTFTAEHFSPYVIYVDTNNLTAGTITDSTPKTGDGVHPKWFLSIGLACLSFVMFMKRDKRELQKVKVRA